VRSKNASRATSATRRSRRTIAGAIAAFLLVTLTTVSVIFAAIHRDPRRDPPTNATEWSRVLTSADSGLRASVLSSYTLGARGDAEPPPCGLVADRLSDVEPVRNEAVGALIKEVRRSRCVSETIAALDGATSSLARAAAARVLGEASASAVRPQVLDALLRAVSTNAAARDAATIALGELRDTSDRALSTLRSLFRDAGGVTRANALETLLHLDVHADTLARLAFEAMRDTSVDVRAAGVITLERLASDNERRSMSVQALVLALHDAGAEVRARAADALAWIGDTRPAVMSGLAAVRGDTVARVSAAAGRALKALRAR